MAFSPTSRSQYLLNQVALSNTIRKLWVDNNQWTRALIHNVMLDQSGQDELVKRVEQNAQDFATIYEQFYGKDSADQIKRLINNDLEGTLRLIRAYKDDDPQAIRSAREALYANANELARFLAGINRYWDMATLQTMLYEIVNLREYETMLIRDKEFAKSIQQHDELMDQGYRLADEITYGILKQFQI